jgi:hypothetical protein
MAKGLGRGRIGREVIVETDRGQSEDAPPRWKPYRDGARLDENYIDLTDTDRVYLALWYDDHQLTDFVMIQQIKRRSRWSEIVKVDCCHQEVHAHQRKPDDSETRKTLQEVQGPADLRIGLDKANDLIFKHWQNNVRRWRRGC